MGTIGEILTSPMQLLHEKSVYVKRWERHCAASFLISMQFRTLSMFFEYGIYKYSPTPKNKTKSFTEIVRYNPCHSKPKK